MPIPIDIHQQPAWAWQQVKKAALGILWSLFLGFMVGVGFVLAAMVLR